MKKIIYTILTLSLMSMYAFAGSVAMSEVPDAAIKFADKYFADYYLFRATENGGSYTLIFKGGLKIYVNSKGEWKTISGGGEEISIDYVEDKVKNAIKKYVNSIFTINGQFNNDLFDNSMEKEYKSIIKDIDNFFCNIFTASDYKKLSNSTNSCIKLLESTPQKEISHLLKSLDDYLKSQSKKAENIAKSLIGDIKGKIHGPIDNLLKHTKNKTGDVRPLYSQLVSILGEIQYWVLEHVYLSDFNEFCKWALAAAITGIANVTNRISGYGATYTTETASLNLLQKGLDRLQRDLKGMNKYQFGDFDLYQNLELGKIGEICKELSKLIDLRMKYKNGMKLDYNMIDYNIQNVKPKNKRMFADKLKEKAKNGRMPGILHDNIADNLEDLQRPTSILKGMSESTKEKLKKYYPEDTQYVADVLKRVKKYRKEHPTSDFEVKRGYINFGDFLNDFLTDKLRENEKEMDRDGFNRYVSHSMQLDKIIRREGRRFGPGEPLVVYKGFGEKYLGMQYKLFDVNEEELEKLRELCQATEFQKIVDYLNDRKPNINILKSFMSTTTDLDVAERYGELILEIHVADGKKFLDFKKECYKDKERLLPRFSHFAFKKAYIGKTGRPMIVVDLI